MYYDCRIKEDKMGLARVMHHVINEFNISLENQMEETTLKTWVYTGVQYLNGHYRDDLN
jgi:hypothetical protein